MLSVWPSMHRHARRVRADDAAAVDCGVRAGRGQRAEDLLRLALELLFFAADERDDVAEDVERRHARVARAGHGLQRRHHHAGQAERAQRRQRHRQEHRRAVRVGDDPALPAVRGLRGTQREVVRVDLGDEQRHDRVHPVVARVADDDVAGLGEGAFDVAGDGGVERGEDELRTVAGRRGLTTMSAASAGRVSLRRQGAASS